MSGFERDAERTLGTGASEGPGPAPDGPDQGTYLLRLYVGGMTSNSLRAIVNLRRLCAEHLEGRHRLEIIDIYQQPMLAKERQIVSAPTLVREFPLPSRRFIGDLSATQQLLLGLGILVPLPDEGAPPPAATLLTTQNEKLQMRLDEAEGTLRAIGKGEVDVFVVSGSKGDQIFTLNGAEHSYRILVESMNEGAVTLACDGTILYCNDRLATLLQMPLETLIGSRLRAQVAPADRPLFDAQWEKSAPRGAAVEISLMTGAGNPVPVIISRSAHDLPGSSGVLSMVVTDLTRQKRDEEILAFGMLAFSIIDQAGEAIIVCDEAGKIIRANSLAQQLCGSNPLLSLFDEQFHLQVPQTGDFFRIGGTLQGHFSKCIEVDLTNSARQTFNLILNATPLKSMPDRIIGCVVTLTDFTERKWAGEVLRQERDRTRSYLDTAETIMVVLDVKGAITTINRKGCQVIGCAEGELLGQLWSSAALQQPGERERAESDFARLVAGEADAATCHESQLIARSGEVRQIAWHDALLRGD